MNLRGITVCIGYAPILEITLVRNLRHCAEIVVVTSPEDRETQDLVGSLPGTRLVITDAATRHGARFNKGLLFETAWDQVGRSGWWLIWDADILFPDDMDLRTRMRPDCLNGARRRILEDPAQFSDDLDWKLCEVSRDGGPIGYFQLFNGDSRIIKNRRPWYDVSFSHAGGGDAYFLNLWPASHRFMMNLDVLHLGPKDTHWFGTDEQGKDMMAAFIVRNGWIRSHPRVDKSACDRVGEIQDRVTVPGYEPSNFELPFVKRIKQTKKG